jgi:hypothetical protein
VNALKPVKHLSSLLAAGAILMLMSSGVHAGGGFSVVCQYSHTLADDSIVHYGQPGLAMMHDFFGNTKTNAFSDYGTLQTNKVTTCDIGADLSAYWAPQLKRASGIVKPDFAKTYYKNDKPVMPVSPIPAGLQMLAGDHRSNSPKAQIDYLCRGSNYTRIAPTHCPVVTDSKGTYSQLNISVHFPECWDGVHLRPDLINRIANMAYRLADGRCPSGYPVKIPELQMNIQYSLGDDPDLAGAQLSMDPELMNGKMEQMWGSMYTAHGDFVSGWKPDSIRYAVDNCSNAPGTNVGCGANIPTYYAKASSDAWMNAQGAFTTGGPTLQVGPGEVIFLKFAVPAGMDDYPWSKAWVQTQGRNVTDAERIYLSLYGATTEWDANATLPRPSDCASKSVGGIYLDGTDIQRLNEVTSYIKTSLASGSKEIGLCVRNTSGKTVVFSSREGIFAPALFFK